MFKKLSTIFLVFLIALYPTVVFADSVVGENEAASEDNVTESQQDVTENEDTIEEEVAQDVEMEEAEVDSEELVVSEVEKLASEEESQEQQEIEVEETEEVVAETSKDHTVQNGAEVSTVQNDEGLSVADDNPALDLQGSIVGKAEFDEEKGYYVLDVTVTAQNQTETSTEGLYVGFKVPENVSVLDTEITPEDLKLLRLDDGSTAVAVKLPEMTTDAEHSITYTIPVFGVSDDRIVDNVINVYAFDENGYHPVGHFSGSIDVDFTAMNLRWDFKAKSQLIKDYPGLEGNQFGLRFSFEAMNLSIHSEEQVKIKFDVPEEITVHEPDQYIGSLDIEWDGNTATIDLGTVNGGYGYEGFFEAIGESTKALEELEGLNVTVMLIRDGTVVEETIEVPFEIASYDDEDGEDGDDGSDGDDGEDGDDGSDGDDGEDGDDGSDGDDGEDGDDGSDGDDGEDGDDGSDGDDGEDGDDGSDGDDGEDGDDGSDGDNGEDGDDGSDGDNGDKDGDKNNDVDQTPTPVDGDANGDGSKLPNTATNNFLFILIGSLLSVTGGALVLVRRRFI